MTKIPLLPASALVAMSDDMRDELTQDLEDILEELRMDLTILQQEIALAEEQLRRVAGAPAPQDYDKAFAKIQTGENARSVREEFQLAFPDVSHASFRNAMARRRKWSREAKEIT